MSHRTVTHHIVVKYLCLNCDRNCILDDTLIQRDELADSLTCPYCQSNAIEPMAWINDQEKLNDLGCASLECDVTIVYPCPDCANGDKNQDCPICAGTGEGIIDDPNAKHWVEQTKLAIIKHHAESGLPLPQSYGK